MTTVVGIDLGTTNTSAAIDGRVLELSDTAHGRSILPSVVAFPPTGATVVGTAARRRRAIDPKNTIFSAKRIIGRRWQSPETREFQSHYPFDLVHGEGDAPAFATRAGTFTPTDIGAVVLSTVRAHCPGSTVSAVVAVPSGFQAPQREATLAAARQAGFSDPRVVDEAAATAWAYLGRRPRSEIGSAVIFDLGGGTFDVAVVNCEREPFQVQSHGGDLYLGGDDVDHILANWAAQEVLKEHHWDLRSDPEAFDRLIVACERAKIRLSYATQTRVELSEVDPAAPMAANGLSLDRDKLAALLGALVQRTFTICDRVLGDAGLKARQIDAVFLAGGSTQLPMVRAGVESYFGKAPRCELDPMEVVGIGASYVT